MAQASGAVGGAVTGATTGSYFGSVGTVVGGVIGAVAGWFTGGTKKNSDGSPIDKGHLATTFRDKENIQHANFSVAFFNQEIARASQYLPADSAEMQQVLAFAQNEETAFKNGTNFVWANKEFTALIDSLISSYTANTNGLTGSSTPPSTSAIDDTNYISSGINAVQTAVTETTSGIEKNLPIILGVVSLGGLLYYFNKKK